MKKYLTALILMVLTVAAATARTYIVSVGIADYPGSESDLVLASSDARALSALFNGNNQASAKTLTDRAATKEAVLQAIKSQFAKATAGDQVVFFFSGHGTPGSIQCYDGGLTYSRIAKAMSGCKAGSKAVFIDACHSGSLRQGNKKPDTSVKKKNIMFFLSCRDNEYSVEFPTMKNGVFTTCLIAALSGKADSDRNRVITARELFDYVNPAAAKLSNYAQHPVMWGNFEVNMPVIKW